MKNLRLTIENVCTNVCDRYKISEMPRAKCPKCQITERILKSGIIRDKQRFYCKDCNYHFTLLHEGKKQKSETKKNNRPTSLKDIAEAAGTQLLTRRSSKSMQQSMKVPVRIPVDFTPAKIIKYSKANL